MEVLGFILHAWIQILAINEFGMVLNRSLGIYIRNLPVESVHVVCVVTYPRFYTPHILSHPSCLHSPPNLILDQSSPPTVRTTVATPPIFLLHRRVVLLFSSRENSLHANAILQVRLICQRKCLNLLYATRSNSSMSWSVA
jgi:hypothetical protein